MADKGVNFVEFTDNQKSSLHDLYASVPFYDLHDHDDLPVFETESDILGWCVNVLSTSPAARAMIKDAMETGWSVALQSAVEYDFMLNVPEKRLILPAEDLDISVWARSPFFRHELLINFIRALRDVWQENRHGAFEKRYGPESVLMLERVRAADSAVMAVFVAWELRGEGYGDVWRHMIGSDLGDMATVFSTYLERDPAALFTGAALSLCFKQWYASHDRINECDHETLEYLDEVLGDSGSGNAFGTERLTRKNIEVLSCLPDKTAYLHGHGANILKDPYFAGLNDEINQAHFLQLAYDSEVTLVHGVPFRDAELASRIFPSEA